MAFVLIQSGIGGNERPIKSYPPILVAIETNGLVLLALTAVDGDAMEDVDV